MDQKFGIEYHISSFIKESEKFGDVSILMKEKLIKILGSKPIFDPSHPSVLCKETRDEIENILWSRWNKTNIKSLHSLMDATRSYFRPRYEILFGEPSPMSQKKATGKLKLNDLATQKTEALNELNMLKSEIAYHRLSLQKVGELLNETSLEIEKTLTSFSLPSKQAQVLEEPAVVEEISELEKSSEVKMTLEIPNNLPQSVAILYATLFKAVMTKIDNKELAHDIVRSSVVRVRGSTQLRGEEDILFGDRILKIVNRFFKCSSPNKFVEINKSAELSIFDDNIVYTTLSKEISDWISPILGELSDRQRDTIDMRYSKHMSLKEIAVVLGKSGNLGAIELDLAFKKIKKILFDESIPKKNMKKQTKKEIGEVLLLEKKPRGRPKKIRLETPVVEEPVSPVVEATPAVEETPVVESTPVVEEASVVEETPVVKTPEEQFTKPSDEEVLDDRRINLIDAINSDVRNRDTGRDMFEARLHKLAVDYVNETIKDIEIAKEIVKHSINLKDIKMVDTPVLSAKLKEDLKLSVSSFVARIELLTGTDKDIMKRHVINGLSMSRIAKQLSMRDADVLQSFTGSRKFIYINLRGGRSDSVRIDPAKEKIESEFASFRAILGAKVLFPVITEKEWKISGATIIRESYFALLKDVSPTILEALKKSVNAKYNAHDISSVWPRWYVAFLDELNALLWKMICQSK